MGVTNRSFRQGSGGKFPTAAYLVLPLVYTRQVPAAQTDLEIISVRLPGDSSWQLVEAYVWCRAVAGAAAKTVNIQDDGTDMMTDTTVVQGAQTNIPFTGPKRLAGGSELQVTATTGAGTTLDDLVVTVVLRPYPLGEAAVAVS